MSEHLDMVRRLDENINHMNKLAQELMDLEFHIPDQKVDGVDLRREAKVCRETIFDLENRLMNLKQLIIKI